MANYLLDTNIFSYLRDSSSPQSILVFNELSSLGDADIAAISVLSLYEHQSSIALAPEDLKGHFRHWQDTVLNWFDVVEVPQAGALI